MVTNNITKSASSFWIGILFSLVASFVLSVICASFIGFGIFPIWTLFAGFITLLGVMVVGIPVVFALKEFNQDTCLNAGLSGGAIVLVIILMFGSSPLSWFSGIFIVYGFVCGFAFSYGYNKEVRK